MMRQRLDGLAKALHQQGKQRPNLHVGTSGEQHKDHNVQQTEAIIKNADMHCGLSDGDAETSAKLPHDDPCTVAIA